MKKANKPLHGSSSTKKQAEGEPPVSFDDWDLGHPPAGAWTGFDPKELNKDLPPPGVYRATIADIKFYDKGDVLWMHVEYTLDGHSTAPRGDLCALAALPSSEHFRKVNDGKRLLYRLVAAVGEENAKFNDYHEISQLLVGRPVMLLIAHRKVDGITELVVRAARPIPESA